MMVKELYVITVDIMIKNHLPSIYLQIFGLSTDRSMFIDDTMYRY